MSNRRKVRETVLQALYAFRLGDHSLEHVLSTIIHPYLKKDRAGLRFAENLFLKTTDCWQQADEIIQSHTQNWEIERLAVLDRLILHMALTELLHFSDIPTKVTINEAIEVAKSFSTARSGQFVNGILDASLESLRREGLLKKTGRGLVDQPARIARPQTTPEITEETETEKTGLASDPKAPAETDQPTPSKIRRMRPRRSKNQHGSDSELTEKPPGHKKT